MIETFGTVTYAGCCASTVKQSDKRKMVEHKRQSEGKRGGGKGDDLNANERHAYSMDAPL